MSSTTRKSQRLLTTKNTVTKPGSSKDVAPIIPVTAQNAQKRSRSSKVKGQSSITAKPSRISIFPSEVLIQIFEEALAEDESWSSQVWKHGHFRTPLRKRSYSLPSFGYSLSLVCRLWHQTITHNNRLWILTLKIAGTQTQMRESLAAATQLAREIPTCRIRLAVGDQPYLTLKPDNSLYATDINTEGYRTAYTKYFGDYNIARVTLAFTDVIAFARQFSSRLFALWAFASVPDNAKLLQDMINCGPVFPRLQDVDIRTCDKSSYTWAPELAALDFEFATTRHPRLQCLDSYGIRVRLDPNFHDNGSSGLTSLSLRLDRRSFPKCTSSEVLELLNFSPHLMTLNLDLPSSSVVHDQVLRVADAKILLPHLQNLYLSASLGCIDELFCQNLDLPNLQMMDLILTNNPSSQWRITPVVYPSLKRLIVQPSMSYACDLLSQMTMPELKTLCSGHSDKHAGYWRSTPFTTLKLPAVEHLMLGECMASSEFCTAAKSWLDSCLTLSLKRLDFAWARYSNDHYLPRALEILKSALSSLEVLSIANLSLEDNKLIAGLLSAVCTIQTLRLVSFQKEDVHKQWLDALVGPPTPVASKSNLRSANAKRDTFLSSTPILPNLQVLEIAIRANADVAISAHDGSALVEMAEARAKMGLRLRKIAVGGVLAPKTRRELLESVDEVEDGVVLPDW